MEHENVFDTESRDNNNSNNNNNDNLESRDAILPNLIIQGKVGSQKKIEVVPTHAMLQWRRRKMMIQIR